MTREMYVSSTPHETKVALVEDDQLAEIFFERENEYTLAGSIYKGRVTRVLPGMQSAFVDIGLERDAFLYVSDFLELPAEDEEEFEDMAVTRPEAFVSHRPPQEAKFEFKPQPAPPEEAAEPEYEGEEEVAEGNTQEFAEAEPPAEATREDGGEEDRFRGNRRRRRGRRGRGFPESKFSRPAVQEPRDEAEAPRHEYGPPAGYQPIVLPGESISKYQRGETPAGPPIPTEAEMQEPPEAERVRESPAAAEPEVHAEPPREPERRPEYRPEPYAPVVLPGESISKYRPRSEEAEPETPQPESPRKAESAEPHESRAPEPSYAPRGPRISVLPGESIAKYQRRAEPRTEQMAREQAEHAAESEQQHARRAATFVIESEPFSETLGREIAREAESHPAQPVEAAESEQTRETPPPEPEEERRIERMNVAAVFGGEEAEAPSEMKPGSQVGAEPYGANLGHRHGATLGEHAEAEPVSAAAEKIEPEALEPATPAAPAVEAGVEPQMPTGAHRPSGEQPGAGSTSEAHVFMQKPHGTVEHEEIEGEEAEFHAPTVDEEFEHDYIELEEETLDAEHFHPVAPEDRKLADVVGTEDLGEAIIQALQHNDDELATEPDSIAEQGEFDEDTEFEEEELLGEEEPTFAEEQQEEAIGGRAETGAPSGTAGYRQRADRERRPFDRQRGRRGGRRGGPPMRRREQPRQHVLISDLLKEGQEVLIQIAKEPIGKKGARITSHIALPGRFLVYMPTVQHIGVSRKITSDEERQRLKRIMISEREGGHGGFIVRTAAAGVGEDELRADIRFLKNLWAQIKSRADNSKAPALIYHDLNLVERILRDQVTTDFSQIWVDNEAEYERIVGFAHRFQPSLVRRIKLYTRETPLFEQFGIHEEINKALKSKVWLKSGGYIVINQTEALVAIDVNTGKYVGKTARLEDTIVKTNVDAIKEIVRQIRLRDLGGIIVIDFIDMDERKNRQKVMQALEEALKADRSPSKVLAFNDFGLVAITRKRVKQSLERTLGTPCPYCTGTGFVKSVPTVCNELYVELKKMARHLEGNDVSLRVNPEVAKALKANSGRILQDLEEIAGRPVLVKADPLLHQEQFDIH